MLLVKLFPKKIGFAYNKNTGVLVIGLYWYALAFDYGRKHRIRKFIIREANRRMKRRAELRKKNRRK